MRRPRALLIVVALAVPGALAAAPQALAAFGPVEPVSSSVAEFVRTDTTPNGVSLLVWTRKVGTSKRVEARFRALDGTYGPVLPISDPSALAAEPSVAVDDAGNGVVAWDNESGAHIQIQARVILANGTLGPVKNVTDGHTDAFSPQVGMGSTGPALVAWSFQDPTENRLRIQATTVTLTSNVAPRQVLSPSGWTSSDAQVAVNPDGKGVVAWTLDDPALGDLIFAQAWARGQGFGLQRELTNGHLRNVSPAVAVNANGKSFVAWKHTNSDGSFTVQGTAGTVVDPAGLLVKISPADVVDEERPALGLDDQGDALVAWDRQASPTTVQLRAREVAADGSLGAGTAVSGAITTQASLFPHLAVTPQGFAMAVWNQPDSGTSQIHARARRIDGTWANQQTLATPGASRLPVVSLDAAGDALAAWGSADSGGIIDAAGQRH
jgi:hypothetical protein